MTAERRASGAWIHETITKEFPSVMEASIARALHEGLPGGVPVVHASGVFVTFARGTPVTEYSPKDTSAMLRLLREIWTSYYAPPVVLRSYDADSYVRYAMRALPIADLQVLLSSAGDVVLEADANCNHVHGDATLENLVWLDGIPKWIDPSYRPCVRHTELDLSKLGFYLQRGGGSVTELMGEIDRTRAEVYRAHYLLNCLRVIARGTKVNSEYARRELDRVRALSRNRVHTS